MNVSEKLPKVGVGVFIIKGDQFLLCQRRGSHGSGSWSIPGGHLEFGETPEICAARETFEESGLVVDPADVVSLGFTNDIFVEENKHYITLYYIAEYTGTEEAKNTEPDRQTAWQWVSWETLCAKELFLPIRNILNTGIQPLEIWKARKSGSTTQSPQ